MGTKPDVLFVVLDSMRRDRVSAYDHHRRTTPELESLATEATRFENAYTPAPWTLPSHCSMFTGLTPSEHGVTNGFTDRSIGLPGSLQTTAETLRERGYRTAGFSNNPWVGQLSGLSRGFDSFVEWDLEVSRDDETTSDRLRDALYSRGHTLLGYASRQPLALLKRPFFTSTLVDRASRWLTQQAARPEPSFAFLNLMEAHSPYYPPSSAFRRLDLDPPNFLESRLLNTNLLAYTMRRTDLSEAQRARTLEFYDACLRYQDRQLGVLFDTLREAGTYDDTLIVVCSDHGKTLGDFDRDAGLTHYMRSINTNVPLFVKWPGQEKAGRVTAPTELTAIHDVISHPDVDETAALTDDEPALTEDFIPHTGKTSAETTRWRAVSGESHRYLRNTAGEEYVLGGRGPDEHVVSPEEEVTRTLREQFEARVSTLAPPPTDEAETPSSLGRSVEGQLEDLGYL